MDAGPSRIGAEEGAADISEARGGVAAKGD